MSATRSRSNTVNTQSKINLKQAIPIVRSSSSNGTTIRSNLGKEVISASSWEKEIITSKPKKRKRSHSKNISSKIEKIEKLTKEEVISDTIYQKETIKSNLDYSVSERNATQCYSESIKQKAKKEHAKNKPRSVIFRDEEQELLSKDLFKEAKKRKSSSLKDFRLLMKFSSSDKRNKNIPESSIETLGNTSNIGGKSPITKLRDFKKNKRKAVSTGTPTVSKVPNTNNIKNINDNKYMDDIISLQAELAQLIEETDDILGKEKKLTWEELVIEHIRLRLRIKKLELQKRLNETNTKSPPIPMRMRKNSKELSLLKL